MTKLLDDILREPNELSRSLSYTFHEGRQDIEEAARILQTFAHLVGIGSGWNAGVAVLSFFNAARCSYVLFDASELLHLVEIPANTTAIILSRSGTSTEVVQLLGRLKSRGCTIIAITNTPDSPLALQAGVVLKIIASFDHQVSISMYSGLVLTGSIGLCIDPEKLRIQDLALARDLRMFGAETLLIGQKLQLPADLGDLVLEIPSVRPEWQFLLDIMPIQVLAERPAHVGNQDCELFRICPYIIHEEAGLIQSGSPLESAANFRAMR